VFSEGTRIWAIEGKPGYYVSPSSTVVGLAYLIDARNGKLGCNCPLSQHRGQECKHKTATRMLLAALGGTERN
jgi:hypothetical protein